MLKPQRDNALTAFPSNSEPSRYAIYWVPPASHPLWRLGNEWLGRDPERPSAGMRIVAPHELTRLPRRYGFHATLKAPMRLRAGARPHTFVDAAATLAAHQVPFDLPPLEVAWLDDFLALRPTAPLTADHSLCALADACVMELDPWRAPISEIELTRYTAARPDDTQRRERAMRWGYPHVLAHWRFHLTLSVPLPPNWLALRRHIEQLAREHFAPALRMPLRVSELALFAEPAPGADLILVQRLSLSAVENKC
jgi:hypothetical protein